MTNTTNNQTTTCSPTIQWKCKASLAWFVCTGKCSWIEKYCLWALSHLRNLAYFKHIYIFFFSPKKCNLVIFTPLTSHFYCYQLTHQTTQHTVRALCSTLDIISHNHFISAIMTGLSLATKLNSLDYKKASLIAYGALLQITEDLCRSSHDTLWEGGSLMLKLGGNQGVTYTPNSSSYNYT